MDRTHTRRAFFLQETSSLVADLRAESAKFESGFTETKKELDILRRDTSATTASLEAKAEAAARDVERLR